MGRLANAMGVVGVICSLTSGVLAEKSIGEEILEMYLKIIGEGGAVGAPCTGHLTDNKKTIPHFWVPWAGWSAARMEKRLREIAREEDVPLDFLLLANKVEYQLQIDKPDKCLLKEALVCDEEKGECVSCREPIGHFDCSNAIKIADAESKRGIDDKTENPPQNSTTGGTEAGSGTEGGKAGSGTGRIVLSVGGTLLAGLIALFSQVRLRETVG